MIRRFLLAFLLLVSPLWCAERATVTIVATSDLHGHIFPLDYATNRPANLGLAKAATIIRQIRKEKPHALLIDCGDTIEGSPLAYLYARQLRAHDPQAGPNPMMLAMNDLDYDAMVVGNHEFNYGMDVMLKAKTEAQFEWLSANITPAATAEEAMAVRNKNYTGAAQSVEKRVFTPMIVEEVDGVSVAIIGLTTPAIPNWERPEHIETYRFEPPLAAAKEWITYAREVRHADVVILATHLGLERSLDNAQLFPGQLPGENAVYQLAQAAPGIDGIVFGHTHQELAGRSLNDVILVQPKFWGQSVAELELTVERDGDGPWKVVGKKSRVIPVTDQVAANPEILRITESYQAAAQKYLDTPVMQSSKPIDAREAMHEVQIAEAKADVSIAAPFGVNTIPAGAVTVRQFAAIYPYENLLVAVEASGQMIKDALENAIAGETASGITYRADLTKPVGQRISDLRWHGAPLDPQQKLRVAVNSYRKAAIFRDAKVLWQSTEDIRQLMIGYYSAGKP